MQRQTFPGLFTSEQANQHVGRRSDEADDCGSALISSINVWAKTTKRNGDSQARPATEKRMKAI